MKTRILKVGVPLLLVAVLVAAVVYPITSSQAAAKGTTYQVVVQSNSPQVSLVSINGGSPGVSSAKCDGTTFQMVVGTKLKTEKVKSTGQKASYYEVIIPKKSFKAPTVEYPRMDAPGQYAVKSGSLAKDAKGKLYVSGGPDVDVISTLGKKLTSKIGDGTADSTGSLLIQIKTVSAITDKATGKYLMKSPTTTYYTTGKSYMIVKGTKTKIEGKALPDDDTSKLLPKPLVGKPIDLEAGTGTLVAVSGTIGAKNKMVGITDNMTGTVYVMTITKQ